MLTAVLEAALILCFCIVVYAYLGYPVVLSLLARRAGAEAPSQGRIPFVSLVIPMHNEANVILQKIENTAALDYPRDRLEVIVIDDGSTDGSSALAEQILPPGWKLVSNQLRTGKPSVLNQAIDAAGGEVVMLSDADTRLPPESVRAIAQHFASEDVGAVTGEVRMADADGPGAAEGSYWRYENGIKDKQSRLGMVMGGSGGTIAFRRALYTPLEPDCLVDEFLILLRIALAGHLVRAERAAAAVHNATPSIGTEFQRRVRIVCGGWQSIIRTGAAAMRAPLGTKFHYVSHRVLRWAVAPYVMLLALALMIILAPQVAMVRVALFLSFAGFVAAGLGAVAVWARLPVPGLLLVPFMVVFLNVAAVGGLIRYVSRSQKVRWERPPRRRRSFAGLTIEVREGVSGVCVLLSGELGGRGVRQLERVWPQWQRRGGSLWLDFGGVRSWDLRGLVAFVTVLGQAHESGIDVMVSSIPVEALNAACLAGLSPKLTLAGEGAADISPANPVQGAAVESLYPVDTAVR